MRRGVSVQVMAVQRIMSLSVVFTRPVESSTFIRILENEEIRAFKEKNIKLGTASSHFPCHCGK
jgi:hypothetical protein